MFRMENRIPASGASARRRGLLGLLLVVGAMGPLFGGPLPGGGQVTAGGAAIATVGQAMTIRQTTERAAISWEGFSVGDGHAVSIVQPSAHAILLNRVVGADPSVIRGALTANGRVFLLNPNGILFAPTAQVDVGGLVASTLAMTDADFMAGRLTFAGGGSAAVINQGNLVAQPDGHGGFVVLVAAKVVNEGAISAGQGSVRLAAAARVTLSLGGVVGLVLEQGAVDALVANGGAIRAPGGDVLLTATAAGDLPSATVNHTGVIEAQTLSTGEQGRILLLAPGAGGVVRVGGRLDVGAPAGGDGGFVETSAFHVAVDPAVVITAWAPFGRTGTWLLDPDVINIANGGGGGVGALPPFGEVSLDPATLNAALSTANVDLQAHSHIDFISPFTYGGSRDAVLGLYAPRINLGADLGSSTAYKLGLKFGGTYAGNATLYAANIYLYDATGGGGLTRTLTTKGGAIEFYGNIGGAMNLTIAAGGGAVVHHAPVDGDFTALVRSPDTTVSLDFHPGAVNAHIVIDYGTQLVTSEGVSIAFTGTMPYGFIRLPAQTMNLNAQKVIHGTNVYCVMTLVDGSAVTFTPLANGDVVVPNALQVTKIEYYTSNASGANFTATGVAFDVLVQATKLNQYFATADSFTLDPGAKVDVNGALTVVTARFVNNGGVGALVAGAGQDWRVWSSNPDPYAVGTGDVVGGLAYDYKQYNLAYSAGAVGLLGTGDGLIYVFAPNLSASLVNTITKTYDGLTTATNLTLANYAASGVVGGDTITFVAGTPTTGTYATADVGSGLAVTVAGISVNNIVGTNRAGAALVYGYGLPVTGATGSIGGITPAPLTITAHPFSKTYDGLAYGGGNGVAYAGFVNGETTAVLGGGITYVGSAQGAVNVGSYAITPGGLTSTNYAITFADGTLTVDQAPLTMTAANFSKTYDGLAFTGGNGVTYAGFVNGETEAELGGTVSYGGTSQGAVNLGNYPIVPSGRTSDNYAITSVAGTLEVSQVILTITANAASKTYDGLAYAGGNGVTYVGFVSGDTSANLGGTLTFVGSAQGAVNAGSYVLTPSGLTSSNYAITFVASTLTVGQAGLAITANPDTKTYNGLAYTGGNGVAYVGFVNAETDAVLGGALTYAGTSQGTINAGSYVLTPGGQTSGNYAITFNDGALTVNQAGLTITANPDTKTYNGLAFTGGNGVAYSGLVNGETDAVLGGALTYAGSSQGAINAGSYVLTPGGQTSGNYAITFTDGALTVNQAGLSITANPDTKTYNGLAYTGGNGVAYVGFVNAETDAVLGGALTYAGTSQGAINAGSYVLTPGGQTSSNYAITFTDGALTVSQAGLTITANADSKTYNGLAYTGGNGVAYSGFVNGETDAVLGGALTYAGTSQGAINAGSYVLTPGGQTSSNYAITFNDSTLTVNQAGLSITANAATKTYDGLAFTGGNGVAYSGFVNGETDAVLGGALTYAGSSQGAINAGSYALTPGGQTSGNYAIAFTDGALTVNQAGLSITANAATKTYDGLAFTGGNGVAYAGFVNGETDAVLGGALTYAGSSQGAINVGSYILTPGGQISGNYAITFTNGALTVNQAGLTITASAATKTYDGLEFTGGNGVAYAGFVNGETDAVLGGALTYAGTSQGAINAGSYVLTPGGQTSGNYAITFNDSTLTVGEAGLTITANAATKTHDGYPYAGGNGVTYVGFVHGETEAVLGGALSYGGTAQGAIEAGNYTLMVSGQTSGNYTLTYVGHTLTIQLGDTVDPIPYLLHPVKPEPSIVLTQTLDSLSPEYYVGGLNYVYANLPAVLGAVSDVAFVAAAEPDLAVLRYDNGTLLVKRDPLSITSMDANKVYDALAYSGGNGVTYLGFVKGETAASLGGVNVTGGTSQGAVNVGAYAMTGSGQTSGDYDITYIDGRLLVTKAPLTIRSTGLTKTYDALAYLGGAGATYEGFVGGQTPVSLGGALVFAGTSQGAVAPGSYTMTSSGLTSGNYALTYAAGTLLINRAALTVTSTNVTKVYDDVPYAGGGGVVYAGFVGGQTAAALGGEVVYGGTSQGAVLPGTYVLMPSGHTSANYAITYLAGTLTITVGGLAIASAEPLVPQFNPDPFALLASPFEAGSPGRRRAVAAAVPPPAAIRNAVLPRPRKVELGVLSGDAGAPIELKVLPRSLRPPVDVFIIKGGLNTGPRFILAE
jgi:filamentous hemagglutinin family protein